jgi:hypothetical protein
MENAAGLEDAVVQREILKKVKLLNKAALEKNKAARAFMKVQSGAWKAKISKAGAPAGQGMALETKKIAMAFETERAVPSS